MSNSYTTPFFVILFIISVLTNFITPALAAEPKTTTPQNPTQEQINKIKSQIPIIPQAETIEGTARCFDYYHFGSVQVQVEGVLPNTVQGIPMHFTGKVLNNNEYPIVDGAVYAKIFRKQKDQNLMHQNGNDLIDQFFVQDNISIPAKGNIPLSFDWKVPAYITSGEYQIVFFFTSAHKFNLLGLSFTDDVVGNAFNFSVKGDQKGTVAFNKNTVTIGDWKKGDMYYRFVASPPHQDSTKDIPVSAEVTNTTDGIQALKITWKLYGWDAQTDDNLLNTKEESVLLKPHETKRLTYIDTNRTQAVHLLVAEGDFKDTKSILNIRYVREGVDTLRLNFPSVLKYPLEANTEQTVFSCLHNANTATVANNKLILTLKDIQNNVIHTYTYEGGVSGAMMAVKDIFTPKETYKTFTIDAQLYHDGTLVDSTTMHYDCEKLGGTDCPKPQPPTLSIPQSKLPLNTLLVSIGTLIMIIGLGVLRHFKKKTGIPSTSMQQILSTFFLIFTCVAVFNLGGVGEVEAKSVVVTGSVPELVYFWNCGNDLACGGMQGWATGLTGAQTSVTYNAQVRDADTNQIYKDGSSVPVGTRLVFEKVSHADTDIYWNGIGATMDTPYGTWRTNATAPEDWQTYFFQQLNSYLTYYLYIPFSVNPPATWYTPVSSNLNCDASGICTVTEAGPVSATVNFAETYGKFYYKYISPGIFDYYTKVAMRTGHGYCGMLQESCDQIELGASDYIHTIPAQSITLDLNAITPNNPPTPPVIDHLNDPAYPKWTGLVDTDQTTTYMSTDPDNDAVRYEIDVYNDGTVDACLPVNCVDTVPSGQVESLIGKAPHGVFPFRARAVDAKGSVSSWTDKTLTIVGPPKVHVYGTTMFGTSDTSIAARYDEKGIVTWTTEGQPTLCTLYEDGIKKETFTPGSTFTTDALKKNINYSVDCKNSYGTGKGNTVEFVVPPPPSSLDAVCSADGLSVALSWLLPSGYTTYYLQSIDKTLYSGTFTDPSFTCTAAGQACITDGKGTTLTAPITKGHTYLWRVATRNETSGAWSNTVDGTEIDCSIPKCTPPQVWNPTTGKCESNKCTGGQLWNSDTKTCECPSGQTWNSTTGKCEPSSGNQCKGTFPGAPSAYMYTGDEDPTGTFSYVYSATNHKNIKCEYTCSEGYVWKAGKSQCDYKCTGGQLWNSVTKTCACPDGQVWDSKTLKCENGSTGGGNPTVSVCDPEKQSCGPTDPPGGNTSTAGSGPSCPKGTKCTTPTISAKPRIVDYDKDVTITYSTGGWEGCTLKGDAASKLNITLTDGKNGSKTDQKVQSKTTYTIDCGGTNINSTFVEVRPNAFET